MFCNVTRLSFSQLKFFSRLLDCSVSSLRCYGAGRQFNGKAFIVPSIKPFNKCRCYSTEVPPPSPFDSVPVEKIAKGDEDLMRKCKVIILEVEVMRQEGMRVPAVMTDERWEELLNLPSKSQRLKLLAFWWLNEKKNESKKKKKEENQIKKLQSQSLEEKKKTEHIYYGFGGSNIFLRIYDSTIDNANNLKLLQAMRFGQDLVIDCSYDQYMNRVEASLCSSQLKIVFADNRLQNEPFNIHFCNVNKEGHVFKMLHKHIPTMYNDAFPMNITDKSYLSLFPKEKLVYLTPHCREEMINFNHDDVYIVGAMVDKVNVDPLSLGKAKSEGLRMARLPLERYLDWGVGCKSLTINQMLLILHELKTSGNWMKALQHVPRRKLKTEAFEKKKYSSPRNNRLNLNSILQ